MTTTTALRALVERGESLAALGWPIIDAHAHLGPTGSFHIPTPDAASMVAMMDRLGIGVTCLASHLAISSDYRLGNDLTAAAVRAHPTRLCGYVVPNPHHPEQVIPELERGLNELGLRAIKLHPTMQDYAVDAVACAPVWRYADERGLAVLCHTWDKDPRCRPALFGPLAEQYPCVAFILGHSGGTRAGRPEAIAVAQAHANIYLDLASSLIHSDEVEWLASAIGAERVVFGTDVPWLDPRFELGKVAYANLSEEQQRSIMGGNIARLLKLDVG
ncbi:MAG: amidohydrolase family protein [Chloroflexota bacterium]